jgi:[ribosomal protein S18]-alanine N-acetyltransferase
MILPFIPFGPLFWLKLFGGPPPAVSPAGPADAEAMAVLHGFAFRRGWSAQEFERLLVERNVVADRGMARADLVAFVLSRLAGEEAEILSIAVAHPHRRRGLARKLLDVHLRRLASYGITELFLEVDEHNEPARRLYAGLGFEPVGRRQSYYQADGKAAAALVLRRDLPLRAGTAALRPGRDPQPI